MNELEFLREENKRLTSEIIKRNREFVLNALTGKQKQIVQLEYRMDDCDNPEIKQMFADRIKSLRSKS